jgi:D-serine deaminase-like pyridoxal phosphate-dependent protein
MVLRIFLGLAVMGVMSTSAQADQKRVLFACTVTGEKRLSPPMSQDAICTKLQRDVDRMLGVSSTRSAKMSLHDRAQSNWVEIDLALSRPGTATVRLARRKDKRVVRYTEFAIDVFDTPLSESTLDMVSREVSRRIKS